MLFRSVIASTSASRPQRTPALEPFRMPVEVHLVRDVRARELPRVVVLQPWVGALSWDASGAMSCWKMPTRARQPPCAREGGGRGGCSAPYFGATPHREFLGRARVEVARREAAKPAIAKARVVFLAEKLLEREAEFSCCIRALGPERGVEDDVVDGVADEELEG